jgi:hypothetical protein
MHSDDLIDTPTTRGGFVRRLGKLTAIGLGVALVPVTNAWAPQSECCSDSTHCSCPGGGLPYFCTGGCGGCCACLDPHPQCFFFSGGCPC